MKKETMLNVLLQFLKEEKADLEKRGLIPTLEEAIKDIEDLLTEQGDEVF